MICLRLHTSSYYKRKDLHCSSAFSVCDPEASPDHLPLSLHQLSDFLSPFVSLCWPERQASASYQGANQFIHLLNKYRPTHHPAGRQASDIKNPSRLLMSIKFGNIGKYPYDIVQILYLKLKIYMMYVTICMLIQ